MGRSVYDNGYLQDNETGQLEILNGPRCQVALRALGEEFIEVAKGIYNASSKHEDTAPVFYNEHFGIRELHHLLVLGIEIYNDDPTAEWVEFGSHAGEDHSTRVLRYRVFGRTADVLEARAHG